MKLVLIGLIVAFIYPSKTHAQSAIDGFMKGRKTLDLALSGAFQTADEYIGANGRFDYKRDLSIFNIFGEYGINDKWDVVATLPVINGQLQDAAAYSKYKWTELALSSQKLSVLSALGFSTPLSNYETQSGQAIGQRATQFHGHIVLQTTLPAGFYWQIQGAYHHTLAPVPSSYTLSSKLMYTKNKFYFDLWYEYQKGLGSITYTNSSVDFRTLTVDYQKIGGVVFYNLKKNWGCFVNASYIFTGLDTNLASTLSLGVTKKLRFSDKKPQ